VNGPEYEDRRDALRAIAYGKDPRVSPDHRMRALEQLREVDSEWEERRREWTQPREEDPDKLAAIIDLGFETGVFQANPLFRSEVERRVVAEVRKRFAVVDAQNGSDDSAPASEAEDHEKPLESESVAQDRPQVPGGMTVEDLNAQWRKPARSLRDIPPARLPKRLDPNR
jgi:hypothetical protein